VYCQNCGKELSDRALFCPSCGEPTKKVEQPPMQVSSPAQGYGPPPAANVNASYPAPTPPVQNVSALWWLVPFFFGLLGGIIGYFMVKSRNPGMARKLLIFGVAWTVVLWIISYAVSSLILGSFGGG